MTCYLPDGGKRPILDVNSPNLIYLWNVPNHLRISQLKNDTLQRFGRVKFVETFEAWTKRKIGQLIIEFASADSVDKFQKALSNKEVMDFSPPINFMRLNPGTGRQAFFDYVKKWSAVDLLATGAIPPSFAWQRETPVSAQRQPAAKVSSFTPRDNHFASSPSFSFRSRGDSGFPVGRGGRTNVDNNNNNNASKNGIYSENKKREANNNINDRQYPVPRTGGSFGGASSGRGGRFTENDRRNRDDANPATTKTATNNQSNVNGGSNNNENAAPQPQNERAQKEVANFGGFGRGRGRGGGATKFGTGTRPLQFGHQQQQQQDQQNKQAEGEDHAESEFYENAEESIAAEESKRKQSPDNLSNTADIDSNSNSPVSGSVKSPDYQKIRDNNSVSSIDEAVDRVNKKTMFIKNLKAGYCLDRILEIMQNYGDISAWEAVDKKTVRFEFHDTLDAQMALFSLKNGVDGDCDYLFGTNPTFELV